MSELLEFKMACPPAPKRGFSLQYDRELNQWYFVPK